MLVTAAHRGDIVATYPLVVAAGQIDLSDEWGKILEHYIEQGGQLIVCADQFSGPGAAALHLPDMTTDREASSFVWRSDGRSVSANTFRYRALSSEGATTLASTEDGQPICITIARGKGRLTLVGIPLGLGIDRRPTPLLALLMQQATLPLMPLHVSGDVEWTLNRLDDGSWLVGLLNNAGVNKPQHGVNPTDLREQRTVHMTAPFPVGESREWITEALLKWEPGANGASSLDLTIPAGAVRLVMLRPGK